MWTTYCHVFEEDFQLISMNHIRLLIRNQCGSHIIHGLPNPLAFQQNYSCYDGPSESGIFSPLDEPLLTSYLPDLAWNLYLPMWNTSFNWITCAVYVCCSIVDQPTPRDRIVQVTRWYLSAFHAGRRSSVAKKPYNPILGEIFRCHYDLPNEEHTTVSYVLSWCIEEIFH